MFRIIIILLLFLSVAAPAETLNGTVIAEKLNVRVFPGLSYTCICVLEKGDEVKVLGKTGDWYQIEAPDTAAVWVSNSFINASQVVKGAKFRAGPSVAYEIYDKADSNIDFLFAGEADHYWTKIKVPKSQALKAWANAKFISLNKPKTITENPMPPRETLPSDYSATALPLPLKKGNDLSFISGLPKTVALDGILMPLDKPESPVTHSVNIKINDELYIIAYAYSQNDNLSLWEKRKVRIKGIQKWIRNWKRPAIEIDKISPLWQ